ncbi:hypothetical protein ISS08_02140 [Candidatus Pacearchaeota archaeon]|nr:hypothetical protein [Candidatus Pacearchaeota archaeon]
MEEETQTPQEAPVEAQAEQPVEAAPVEAQAEQPVEAPAEAPVEAQAEQPAEAAPVEAPAEAPVEAQAEQPVEAAPIETPSLPERSEDGENDLGDAISESAENASSNEGISAETDRATLAKENMENQPAAE